MNRPTTPRRVVWTVVGLAALAAVGAGAAWSMRDDGAGMGACSVLSRQDLGEALQSPVDHSKEGPADGPVRQATVCYHAHAGRVGVVVFAIGPGAAETTYRHMVDVRCEPSCERRALDRPGYRAFSERTPFSPAEQGSPGRTLFLLRHEQYVNVLLPDIGPAVIRQIADRVAGHIG